jgi:hypothetical protein
MLSRFNRTPTPPPAQLLRAEDLTVPADGFIAETAVEAWVRAGLGVRKDARLELTDGRALILVEGLRILGRRDGESDPYSLTGRVMTLGTLVKRGATLNASGARLGAATYDIELGYVVSSLGAG